MYKLLKFLMYVVNNAITPKTITNKLARSKVISIIDERYYEWRTLYLKNYLKFQDELILLPRVLDEAVLSTLVPLPDDDSPNNAVTPLVLLVKNDSNKAFIQRVNKLLISRAPILDVDSQDCYGDVFDHLAYAMMVSTVCMEMGTIAGRPGQINQTRLDHITKEPVVKGKSRSSTGPFQIYDSSWKSLSENLPHHSFYVHGAYFFYIARSKHDLAIKAMREGVIPFTGVDPSWMVDLYLKRDLLSYLLLWRRYYQGEGNLYKLKRPDGTYFDGDEFHIRNLAFAINALAIMRERDKFRKHYPTDRLKVSERELWDILDKAVNS